MRPPRPRTRSSKRISTSIRLRKCAKPKEGEEGSRNGGRMNYATRSPPRPPGALRGPARDRRAAQPPVHGRDARLLRRGARRLQHFHAEPGDPSRRARRPRLLHRSPNDLRFTWHCRHVPPRPRRLFALPRVAGRHLHLPMRKHLPCLRLRVRGPRVAALVRTSLLQFPAIGARQAPARARACRVRDRWRQARVGEAAHGALPLPRPGAGCARLPAAGPRHRSGVRGNHPRRDVRGGRPLDALRGNRRDARRSRSHWSSSWRPQSGRRS